MKTTVDDAKLKEIIGLLEKYQECVDPNSKRDYSERMAEREKIKAELKAIGAELDQEGSMLLMQGVAAQVKKKNSLLASYLDSAWNGVGYWMG